MIPTNHKERIGFPHFHRVEQCRVVHASINGAADNTVVSRETRNVGVEHVGYTLGSIRN
jgi:hypothetical protein